MMRATFRRSLKALALLVCLSATPAFANSLFFHEEFYAHLYGVDNNGNPSFSLGTDTAFDATINTKNGTYLGTARDTVTNNSRRVQLYVNSGAFIYGQIAIKLGLYIVDGRGNACLIATGNVTSSD